MMEEMFNQFIKIKKDLIKAGPKPVISEARKKNSQGGIYGFLHKIWLIIKNHLLT
jgi:hypothetical protein